MHEESSPKACTAGLVVVGNEILTGKTRDENAFFLARELHQLGVDLRQIHVVRDEPGAIARSVQTFAQAYRWVFTSGGIGPTHDDMTLAAVAQAFQRPLILHEPMAQALREHYGERLREDHLSMAKIPQGATLIPVPGWAMAQVCLENVFIMPGIPKLFRHRFALIRPRLSGQAIFLLTWHLHADEAMLAQAMEETAREHPGVEIGSYPRPGGGDHTLQITLEGRNQALVAQAGERLREKFHALGVTLLREDSSGEK